jgi:excinuclease UvrABC nuclease subunit
MSNARNKRQTRGKFRRVPELKPISRKRLVRPFGPLNPIWKASARLLRAKAGSQ